MDGRKFTFSASATLSMTQPITHNTRPAISFDVPNAGAAPLVTAGELRIVIGRETTQTYVYERMSEREED